MRYPLLATGFAMVRTIALSDRIRFAHIGTAFGLPVPTVRWTVIYLTAAVDPYLARAATSGSSGRGRRGRFRRGDGRRCCRSRGRRGRRSGGGGRRAAASRRRIAACRCRTAVPILHSLMAVTCALLRGTCPISTVAAQTGRTGRRTCRCLRNAGRREQYARHGRNNFDLASHHESFLSFRSAVPTARFARTRCRGSRG
jgi:hypothetical protein